MDRERKWNALTILNILMQSDDYLTTKQIADKANCERKAVYNCVDMLEINGFGIDVIYHKGQNRYKYRGIYGI